MTDPQKIQIEGDLENDNHLDTTIEPPSTKSEHDGDSIQLRTEVKELPQIYEKGPLTIELLNILSVIALRIAAKRQQQEKQDKGN